jgi:hypothetical protein
MTPGNEAKNKEDIMTHDLHMTAWRPEALKKIMDYILSDALRALGVKDEQELGQLPVRVMWAYGHGAGLYAPPIYPWPGETP